MSTLSTLGTSLMLNGSTMLSTASSWLDTIVAQTYSQLIAMYAGMLNLAVWARTVVILASLRTLVNNL